MGNNEPMEQKAGFRDMKTGLMVFGILLVIGGGFCAMAIPMMILALAVSSLVETDSAAALRPATVVPAVAIYAAAAAWFITMGIGSIRARRWARALVLVTSWMWLVGGVAGFIFVVLLMPDTVRRMENDPQVPRSVIVVTTYVTIGFRVVLHVIIPAALVLFYGNRNVKATCEWRDPKVRWTDKCPLPVLALSLMFGLWAGSVFFIGFYGWVIPFFGVVLSGVAGAAVGAAGALLYGCIAWGLYRLRMTAWWGAVVLQGVWAVSSVLTFSRVSMLDFCEKMGFSQQQLDMLRDHDVAERSAIILLCGLWLVGFMGYMLYTRRYFVHSGAREGAADQLLV